MKKAGKDNDAAIFKPNMSKTDSRETGNCGIF